MNLPLGQRATPGSRVERLESGWHLEIPAGPARGYRWAQIDDYMDLARKQFGWSAPVRMELRARVSAPDLNGTWGFGFWNDPFSMQFGLGGTAQRLPALPQAAWFFFASPPNYLAFRDDHPAQGLLAATFAERPIPRLLAVFAPVLAPFLAIRPLAKRLRRLLSPWIAEDAVQIISDPTVWHHYQIDWLANEVIFNVDGGEVLRTLVSPRAPLGLVIWIDNQYAAFTPQGEVRLGVLAGAQPGWLEIQDLSVQAIL